MHCKLTNSLPGPMGPSEKNKLLCRTKFLWEFNFVDRQFFVFCGKYFLGLGKTGFACWE